MTGGVPQAWAKRSDNDPLSIEFGFGELANDAYGAHRFAIDHMTLTGLEALFLEHRRALLRFLLARGAGDNAEDLLQELWMRVAGASTRPIAEPLSYLMRAANNLMLDRYRAQVRTMTRDLAWSESTLGQSEDGSEPSAERMLIGREALARAEAALKALGPRTEAIFRRFRLDEVTIEQVAREFGVSRSTVEKDLQKAYRALLKLRSDDDA